MKRIKDPNAQDLPEPPNTKVCPVCEKLWDKGTAICVTPTARLRRALHGGARIEKAYEAYVAAPDRRGARRAYFDLLEPDPVIFRAVPYPAPLKLRTLSWKERRTSSSRHAL